MANKNLPQAIIRELSVAGATFHYYSLAALAEQGHPGIHTLPASIKVLLENQLRHMDHQIIDASHVDALINWTGTQYQNREIMFMPVRVLMQDFTGVPAVVDLAAMRDAVTAMGGDPSVINPVNPVDLVIDHSVMVDRFADDAAYPENVRIEMERNRERYQFLRWGQKAFNNFRVVPPGTGICHQVNLEYLARTVWSDEREGKHFAFPDTVVGTDSHTTMINGLAVLGWGVGGIEAEAAMLGQPISMNIPEVVGFKVTGKLQEGITATDLVLTVAEMLRKHGVVSKFVEFYGSGLQHLTLADRATIANMAPEYGATSCYFSVDDKTLDYLRLTGRDATNVALVEAYSKAQGLWRRDDDAVIYSSTLELQLDAVVPCLAGPKRPQDRVALPGLKQALQQQTGGSSVKQAKVAGSDVTLKDGDVVIAAITSCTNTSNPAVMMAAGLVAQKALAKGLQRKPWVKSSLAPGSRVVTTYLEKAGLQQHLDALGFNLVGYGCTTCIGNSGPLAPAIEDAIDSGQLTVSSVLSGNRNFEGRIHPKVRANWLASPPLVVAFALAGTTNIDLTTEPLGNDKHGKAVYLQDIWPSSEEIAAAVRLVENQMFSTAYADVFKGDAEWNSLPTGSGKTYAWDAESTYIQQPPFCELEVAATDVESARILMILGDSVTTDHISPAGSIAENSPAGKYLLQHKIAKGDFNSYGSRRGNHEVMLRGTFANVRIRNEMLAGIEGGYTHIAPDMAAVSVYDAALSCQKTGTPLVVFAGKEYGTGSSRDWAAKGTALLGVRAVIAESFERIHRSNLAGMGVLPLQFPQGITRKTLRLDGSESINLRGLKAIAAGMTVRMEITDTGGNSRSCDLICRLDTALEVAYFTNGGIMPYVVRQLTAK
ncbi:MAG: aconitate hydratase AcnA [Gammaproteobacteria bacterium]|nr:aconitate hydratase AcnA [Gammaproteobacteria bacterium]